MKPIGRRAFLIGAAGFTAWALLDPQRVAGWLTRAGTRDSLSGSGPQSQEPRPAPPQPRVVDCDVVLQNGTIVDGTGRPAFTGNVGIKGEYIVDLGYFEPAPGAEIIDVTGLVVAPGFIDLHAHTEDYHRHGGTAEMILLQGVTSQITGNCGTSVDSVADYLASLQELGVNVGIFVGYKNLRRQYVGEGKTTNAQLEAMQDALAEGLAAGAFGLSVGLEYWPQMQATTEEMIALCEVLKDCGGFWSVHIRNENDRVLEAVEEAIEIGMRAGVPVEYSHVKALYERNWGKMPQILSLVEGAAQSGLDITGDVYGYNFSSWDVGSDRVSMAEEDLQLALSHPLVMVGSDSGLSVQGRATHPRAYGNYPRILRRYVREEKVLSLEAAVQKMTAMPARRLGLKERGVLAAGMKADIVVFDLKTVTDSATRANPNALSQGMHYVFVNGQKAVQKGEPTGILAGQVLVRG